MVCCPYRRLLHYNYFFPPVEMYAELIFNSLIGEQCPDIELSSPVVRSQILGRSKKFLFSELQVGYKTYNSILNIFNNCYQIHF